MTARLLRLMIAGTFLSAMLGISVRAQAGKNEFALIPAGQFEMGDHHNLADPQEQNLRGGLR
jgi:hypothetical protein